MSPQQIENLKAVIGTLSHNRTFTAKEITEYTAYDRRYNGQSVIAWLRSHDYISDVYEDNEHRYYPTLAGWRWIEGTIV